jgi:hypothetical protein
MKLDALTLWFTCKHIDTPWAAKILCMVAVVYAFSPIDLIPDFVPVLLPCLVWLAVKLLPPAILAGCRAEATEWMDRKGAEPKNNWGILLVVLVWITIACLFWNRISPRT